MKVQVTILETYTTQYTYEIDGVNNVNEARTAASTLYYHPEYHTKGHLMRTVPLPREVAFGSARIVDPN